MWPRPARRPGTTGNPTVTCAHGWRADLRVQGHAPPAARRRRVRHRPGRGHRRHPRSPTAPAPRVARVRRRAASGGGSSSTPAGSPTLDNDGARLRSWDVDLNPFKPRRGEVLIGRDIIDRKIGDETVSDVALRPKRRRPRSSGGSRPRSAWPGAPRCAAGRATGSSTSTTCRTCSPTSPGRRWPPRRPACATCTRATSPAFVRALPLTQRRQLAEAMDDERLADLLEELPEAEQLRIIDGLDIDRLVNVLDEMEYDDLADLLAEMPGEQRTRVLEAMDADDADVMRRLLSYEDGTAGAPPHARHHHPRPDEHRRRSARRGARPGLAGRASPPRCSSSSRRTSRRPARYLGVVHFQRLLREPPNTRARAVPGARAVDPAGPPRARCRRAPGQLQHARRRGDRRASTACSARSPSTTCSTAPCRPVGASVAASPCSRGPRRAGPQG